MNEKKWLAMAMAVLMLLSLAACGKKGAGDGDLAPSDYLPDTQPMLDIEIPDYLSAEEVSTVMGMTLTLSGVYEHGTWVMYSSEDGLHSVSVSMENTTIPLYDAMISELSSGEAESSLGYRAFWYGMTGEMINYCEGYSIAVSINEPTVQSTRGLCQAVMRKLIDNLQATK